ncbi:MAG: AcrB/AcrD/AcrF family protein [Acidobacteria bacterium]|nr:MAG: AcrB/AcrD/AcrF family protein [Acidobacteriota bacterium]REJ99470.1 MAG: AcrB/AcrD/AcrF family protein [Acidobacteriota bacterium]
MSEQRTRRYEEALPRFSLDRRISVVVLVATLLVLGVVATVSIPLELIPSGYSESFLRVAAPWQDAPPQEVLDKVVLPLEEELATAGGLSNIYSFARNGYGQIFMTFKHGTDMDVAYREVRDRIERARLEMPDDLEQVFIFKDDDTSMPVAMVGLAVEEGTTDVYDLIENEIKLQIERLEGVASVTVNGLEEKEILIELDRERVEAAGLNIYAIAQDLARDNFSLASGNVRAGDRKLLLRSVARFERPDSLREFQVTPTVKLADIASIRYDEPEKDYRVRVNSRPAYALAVAKEGQANTLEVATRVDRLLDERLATNPRLRSIEMDVIMDQGSLIRESLSTLLDSGRIGAMFAMLVLFFFLRRFRLSLIVALSIPLSMVVALVVMYFAGESLNILSLLGLMISIGLLVDNSVVVAENIHRLFREEGLGRREAAIRGAGEIALAITTATLTTIIVFLPVALVEGQGQFFLLRLAIPISVSLAASLFVALVIVPLGVFLSLPKRGTETRRVNALTAMRRRMDPALERFYERTFGRLNRAYGVALGYFLTRRFDLVLALVAAFALTQFVARGRVEVVPMSEDDMAFLQIEVEMPDNVSFEETEAWFRAAEQRVERVSEELGIEFYILVHRREWGQIQAGLATEREIKLSAREVTDRLLAELPELPGTEFHTGMASQAEQEQDLATETVRVFGDDAEQLGRVVDDLKQILREVPGVFALKRDEERAPNEVALQLDRDLTQRQGVDPRVLAGVVGYALRGQTLPRVYLGGRDIPVRLRFEEQDRDDLSQLADFSVPTGSGEEVALGSLVDVRTLPTASTIFRHNKQTSRAITLELAEDEEEEARAAIYERLARIDLPEGVSLAPRAARGAQSDEARNLQFAALLSIVFVYLLMGFLFESFVLPLSILVTIPLANLGVSWAHILAGRDMDFLGLVGVVILIGVVVNNGIVLLDYVRRLRERGHERDEALLLATQRRFRPILMTALTTICGMVPLTLGEPMQMGLSYKSFGLTLIGGMVTSSLLTLLVVPVFYTFFEDARAAMGRAALSGLGAARRRGRQPAAGDVAA